MGEPKLSPYNKYESPHIISLKIEIHHRHYSNDGSLSVPLPFHHHNQALLGREKKIWLTIFCLPSTWSKMHSGVAFFFSSLQSASLLFHLSLSFFSFPLSLPPLFPRFGETCMSLWFMSRPEHSDRKTQTLSSLSLSHITTFPAMGKLQISFFFFFFQI